MRRSENETLVVQPSFGEAVQLWLKIGLISFGGPAAQIAILHEELVERRRWIDERTFLTALNFCMLLPGPEAQQLAIYMGRQLHGVRGAIAAGVLFLLPGAAVLFGLAWLAAAHGDWPPLGAAFRGMLPIAFALVVMALFRIAGRTLKTRLSWAVAASAFAALTIFEIGFPWVLLAAIATGILADRFGLTLAAASYGNMSAAKAPASLQWRLEAFRIVQTTLVSAILWAAPIALTLAFFGPKPFLDIATFFTKAAFVTFGGAYAVLPYVAEKAVETYSWLSKSEMVHGLALAETTPGPLILVTQYVGFFAGWNAALAGQSGGLTPFAAATIAAGITTWVTFLPSFWFILIGAPLVDHIARVKWAAAALSGVSAAVVGVIGTLAHTVGHVALNPDQVPDFISIGVALAAFVAGYRCKISALWLVLGGAAIGIIRFLLLAP